MKINKEYMAVMRLGRAQDRFWQSVKESAKMNQFKEGFKQGLHDMRDLACNAGFWGYLAPIAIFVVILTLALIIFGTFLEGTANAQERDYTKAVIHHTASHDVSAAEIDRWHKERGWDGIGYHYVLRRNGNIEKGRGYDKQGAHAKGRNHFTGIVLTGYDSFTDGQRDALVKLIRELKITHIESHHEKCVGNGLDLSKIRARAGIE